MPYTASLSRSEFLKQTDELVLHAKHGTDKKPGTVPAHIAQMLLQAAIFRTSALKDSVSNWLSLANKSGVTCSSMPVNLKWFLVSQAHSPVYREFYSENDEKKLLEKLRVASPNFLLNASNPIAGMLNSAVIVGNRKYPSVKNIKAIFNRIGVPNIFHRLNAITKRDSEKVLQSFLDIRQAIPPNLTYQDVRSYIRNVQGIVRTLDRILYTHGRRWRTAQHNM